MNKIFSFISLTLSVLTINAMQENIPEAAATNLETMQAISQEMQQSNQLIKFELDDGVGRSINTVGLGEGLLVISSSDAGRVNSAVLIYEASTGRFIRELDGHKLGLYSIAIAQDTMITANWHGINVFSCSSGQLIKAFPRANGGEIIKYVALDKEIVIACPLRGPIELYNIVDGTIKKLSPLHSKWIMSLASANEIIVTGSLDDTAIVRDSATGKLIIKLQHESTVFCVAIANDTVVTCSRSLVNVYNTKTGVLIQLSDCNDMRSVAVDDKIVIGTSHGTILLYTLVGEFIQELSCCSSAIKSVKLHKNSLVAHCEDQIVRVLDIN